MKTYSKTEPYKLTESLLENAWDCPMVNYRDDLGKVMSQTFNSVEFTLSKERMGFIFSSLMIFTATVNNDWIFDSILDAYYRESEDLKIQIIKFHDDSYRITTW